MHVYFDRDYLDKVHAGIQEKVSTVEFHEGLTTKERKRIEAEHNFKFPPDLAEFLQYRLPVTSPGEAGGFPDWRSSPGNDLNQRIWSPLDRTLFDVDYGQFWIKDWGRKPGDPKEAAKRATKAIRKAPILIPIYTHRCIPSEPHEAGNPVYSMWQAVDTIYYGYDLRDYFRREFRVSPDRKVPQHPRRIRFWTSVVEREWLDDV